MEEKYQKTMVSSLQETREKQAHRKVRGTTEAGHENKLARVIQQINSVSEL